MLAGSIRLEMANGMFLFSLISRQLGELFGALRREGFVVRPGRAIVAVSYQSSCLSISSLRLLLIVVRTKASLIP